MKNEIPEQENVGMVAKRVLHSLYVIKMITNLILCELDVSK